MCLFLKARIQLLDWACFPANRKDQPMDYEKAMQMFLNVAQLDEACLGRLRQQSSLVCEERGTSISILLTGHHRLMPSTLYIIVHMRCRPRHPCTSAPTTSSWPYHG